jgi:hypothetical protein
MKKEMPDTSESPLNVFGQKSEIPGPDPIKDLGKAPKLIIANI